MKNATNDTISPTTRVTPPNTTTFAARTKGRRGTAAKVARMVPVLYSALDDQDAEHADGQLGEQETGQTGAGWVEGGVCGE